MVSLLQVEQTKVCAGPCGERKPLSQFHVSNKVTGCTRRKCKKCNNAQHAQYYAENLDRIRQWRIENSETLSERRKRYRARNRELIRGRRRSSYFRQKYRLTETQLNEFIARQHGKCKACGDQLTVVEKKNGKASGKKRPVVHHDHVTGFVIDILCNACNLAEGLIGTAVRAERLAKYMRKNEPTLFPKRLGVSK